MIDMKSTHFPNRKDFPDVGLLRPYFDDSSVASVTWHGYKYQFEPNRTIVKRCVLTNAEWMEVDRMAFRAIKYRMPFVGKLMGHNLFDEEPGWRDDVDNPIPFTHTDAWYSMREIECCRSGTTQLEKCQYTILEAASRRVGECLEQTTLGMDQLERWRKANCWMDAKEIVELSKTVGMFNHPTAIKVKCPKLNQDNVHQVSKLMLSKATTEGLTGPFMFVHGLELDQHLDNDFRSGNGHEPSIFTNRQAIKDIVAVGNKHIKVLDVMRSDFLQDEFGLVQMTKDVVKVRVGQHPIVVQWADGEGEMRLSFKVLAVMQTEFSGKGIVLAEQEK